MLVGPRHNKLYLDGNYDRSYDTDDPLLVCYSHYDKDKLIRMRQYYQILLNFMVNILCVSRKRNIITEWRFKSTELDPPLKELARKVSDDICHQKKFTIVCNDMIALPVLKEIVNQPMSEKIEQSIQVIRNGNMPPAFISTINTNQ